jgi:hypothetical protein
MFNEKTFFSMFDTFEKTGDSGLFLIIYMTFTSKFEFFKVFKNIC